MGRFAFQVACFWLVANDVISMYLGQWDVSLDPI